MTSSLMRALSIPSRPTSRNSWQPTRSRISAIDAFRCSSSRRPGSMPSQPSVPSTSRLTALVTGCSSGFGELIAKTLATDGHHVYATMRGVQSRNATAADTLRHWAREQDLTLDVLELDVTDDASVQTAVARVLASADGIDVVVNNAGASAIGPLEAFSIEQMASLLDLNVLGPMRVNQAVLPTMRARQSGLIVWITSTLGRVLPGRAGLYPATK